MAPRRGLPTSQPPMDAKELEDYRKRLAMMQPFALQRLYEEAWRDCRLVPHRVPNPRAIQELVQVCKALWKGAMR